MFLIVLIILIILRTIKLKFQSILRNKVTFTKSILLRKLLNFIKKEVKFLIYLYIGLIGLYVLIERMLKYNIYPANIKSINNFLLVIHDMNTNEFIYKMYLNMIFIYVTFILPYRLIKFYNQTIKDINSKDYLNLFIVNNLNEIKNKYKKTENK